MKQYLLFLLVPIIVFAQDNVNLDMRAKANSDGVIVKAKFELKNEMISFLTAQYHGIEANFISHITAIVENKIVLDMSISPYLRRFPVIKYKFKDIDQASSIKYTITDIQGRKKEHIFEIKRNQKTLLEQNRIKYFDSAVVDFRKTNPLAWNATNINKAIKELYGSVENPIKSKINLFLPQSECSFPIEISSNIDLESFAVIIETRGIVSTLAVFSISSYSIVDYKVNARRPYKDYTLVIIGKDRDGKFYKEIKKGYLHKTDDTCL